MLLSYWLFSDFLYTGNNAGRWFFEGDTENCSIPGYFIILVLEFVHYLECLRLNAFFFQEWFMSNSSSRTTTKNQFISLHFITVGIFWTRKGFELGKDIWYLKDSNIKCSYDTKSLHPLDAHIKYISWTLLCYQISRVLPF